MSIKVVSVKPLIKTTPRVIKLKYYPPHLYTLIYSEPVRTILHRRNSLRRKIEILVLDRKNNRIDENTFKRVYDELISEYSLKHSILRFHLSDSLLSLTEIQEINSLISTWLRSPTEEQEAEVFKALKMLKKSRKDLRLLIKATKRMLRKLKEEIEYSRYVLTPINHQDFTQKLYPLYKKYDYLKYVLLETKFMYLATFILCTPLAIRKLDSLLLRKNEIELKAKYLIGSLAKDTYEKALNEIRAKSEKLKEEIKTIIENTITELKTLEDIVRKLDWMDKEKIEVLIKEIRNSLKLIRILKPKV